jgi:hypothetical protein
MKRLILLAFSHAAMGAVGFALGVYTLPILIAPASPDGAMLNERAQSALYSAEFTRDLRGSDFLHWGEGTISLTQTQIIHEGRLAPGPDYKLYLVPDFVEHEDEFSPIKDKALQIGDIKTFDGFLLDIPQGVDLGGYTTVVIWCEAFSEFITAAKFR